MAISVRLPDVEHWKSQVKCQAGCPVSTDAGRYVQLIAEGRYEEAFLVARPPNPFASICGRVCAAPCEDACRRGAIDAPVAIRALTRFVTESYGVESTQPGTQDRLAASAIEEGNRHAGHMPLAFHRASLSVAPRVDRRLARAAVLVRRAAPLARGYLSLRLRSGTDNSASRIPACRST